MIKIKGLVKSFGAQVVTNRLDLEVPEGKITCIIGRSGEGKSVLLKQIIGLIKPDRGKIIIDGVDITRLSTSEQQKMYEKCGYVFQFAALLDSLTIFENVGISLLEQGKTEQEVRMAVMQKLAEVDLSSDVLDKYPSELSGGMRKRVGLARTLIRGPKIILYDEPTTGLDPITSRVVHELIASMQRRLRLTSVVASHDIEIFKYVDYVALLHEGKIRYFGDAKSIWESDNPYIYQFIRGLEHGPIKSKV